MTRGLLPALAGASFRRLATIALLTGLTILSASSLAADDPKTPAPRSPAGTPSAPPRDLSGIWDVRVTATVVGSALLCRAVPELHQSQLDTVLKARNLKELFYAVIPDTSRAWFDSVCKPTFSGDMMWGTCRIPITYANPCDLVADVAFRGQLRNDREFTGEGNANVTTGGPGLCPEATCPGQVRIVARRVADLPRTAPK
jgi:hypothetical protein